MRDKPALMRRLAEIEAELARWWPDGCAMVAIARTDVEFLLAELRAALTAALSPAPQPGDAQEAAGQTLIEHLVSRYGALSKDTMDIYNATITQQAARVKP